MRARYMKFVAKLGALYVLFFAAAAHAQTFKPLADANQSPLFQSVYNSANVDLGAFANAAFKAALSLGAILAVLRLAYAGYLYMTSEAWGEKSHARSIIGDAILGLLLLLSIYLILYQINPELTQLNVLKKIPAATSGTQ